MLTPDAELILAIMAIKKKISANIKCRYVASHQDEKKRKVKSSKQRRKEKREKRKTTGKTTTHPDSRDQRRHTRSLPKPIADEDDHHASDTSVESVRELGAEKHLLDKVQINVACDGTAGEAAERFISDRTQALPPTLQPQYSG